jgi:hypothetical protein
MDFVEGFGLRGAELDEPGGTNGEPRAFEVRNDLSREGSLDGVGLDDGECEHEDRCQGLGVRGQ